MAKVRKAHFADHSFYCLNCGEKGIPIIRDKSHLRDKNHRKALYCPHCKQTVNHIETRTLEEAIQFKENFAKGLYKEEAEKSIQYLKEEAI